MPSSGLIRWGAIGFMLGGAVWVVSGLPDVLSLVTAPTGPEHSGFSKKQLADYLLSEELQWRRLQDLGVRSLSWLLSALGLVGLHALQEERYGRLGWAGFYTALAATAVRLLDAVASLSVVASFLWGRPFLVLGSFLWPVSLVEPPVGFLGSLVGFVLLGVATLRARVLPRWYGVLLIVLEPVAAAQGVWMLVGRPVTGFLLFAFPPDIVAFWGPWAIWRGLVFLVLGYALWLQRGTPARQPSGAS